MLKINNALTHVRVDVEHVVSIYESINQPLINIPQFGTAPTNAYIAGARNDRGKLCAYVYLIQPETRAVVIYSSDPAELSVEQYRAEEAAAMKFVESMGFMMDNPHFAELDRNQKMALVARVPMFRPPETTMDLLDVAEENRETHEEAARSPSSDLDAMFGGLTAAENEVFRQAGLVIQQVGKNSEKESVELEKSTPQKIPGISEDQKSRLARLLSAFVFLLALSLFGCRTTEGDKGPGSDAKTFQTYVDLGNQQLAERQWPESIKTFELILETDPKHVESIRGLGLAYMNLGRLEQSERYYRQVLLLDPKQSTAKNELAVVLTQMGLCAEAETLLSEVLNDIFYQTPEFAEHNLAQALVCQGKLKPAITRLERLMVKRPHFCLGYLSLADFGTRDGRPEVTLRACDQFTTQCEQHEQIRAHVSTRHLAQCHLYRGLAYARMGDVESARSSLERCKSDEVLGQRCSASLRDLLH